MDIKNIKKIIDLMKANDLCEFEMEEEGFRIGIKRRNGSEPQVVLSSAPQSVMMAQAAPAMSAVATTPGVVLAADAAKEAESKFLEIKSPIVGTFYRSASPDAEPYVTVGKEVEGETVVCIIEAMKVMNEIKAECKGVIRKILVENATPVQFGQVLFLVEPA
ncbi:MAG TPA: acetyl-CoA carboxylase biotin carboxyl carrier protein [Kiritimatiellia bacterium]|nr:acetyl-CoA carboxylase biotin carboxyl carrier protein [Kiritimatiellia bacterium]